MTAAPAVESPCIKVCIVDGRSGFCLGCLRTLPEIARWSRLSADEQRAIVALAASRRSLIAPGTLARLGEHGQA
jgi:predicted Fe-S protein YdhL (DUF1289 family)